MSQHELETLSRDVEPLLAEPAVPIGRAADTVLSDEEHRGEPLLGVAIAVALSLPIWGVIAAIWYVC